MVFAATLSLLHCSCPSLCCDPALTLIRACCLLTAQRWWLQRWLLELLTRVPASCRCAVVAVATVAVVAATTERCHMRPHYTLCRCDGSLLDLDMDPC